MIVEDANIYGIKNISLNSTTSFSTLGNQLLHVQQNIFYSSNSV